MTRVRDEYDYEGEDIAYREDVQRGIDERDEALRRNASGTSPEVLCLQDAYFEGQRAGARGTAAGCNPWINPASPEYQAWERGRSAAELARLNRHRRAA